MRKPLNTTVPEELIAKIDQLVIRANGSFRDRSHFVEQAISSYMTDELVMDPKVRAISTTLNQDAQSANLYETSLFPRMKLHREEKREIAKRASSLIEMGTTLFIDGSTTCLELAKILVHINKPLTIVTNSSLICLEFGKTSIHKVIGLGGDFDPTSASFVGSQTEESVQKYFVDMAVLSTKGILPDDGTYESNIGTLRVKQAVSRNARKIMLLADGSKFFQRSLCKVMDITQIDIIVTDSSAPEDALRQLQDKEVQTVISAHHSSK